MNASSTSGRWVLNHDALAHLLAVLGTDPDAASHRYESLRRRLIDLFAWERSAAPEDAADETLNRLAKRLADGVTLEDSSIERYSFGIARFVLLEEARARRNHQAVLDDVRRQWQQADDSDLPQRLERCLEKLPKEQRDLIERYYSGDRDGLARSLGISLNALRNRALRIRERLYDCAMRGDDRDV
jgi:DNA-directed RNA polymerase specialized sigma24 family protein